MSITPGFRPDLLADDFAVGRVDGYVPRLGTAVEAMEAVSFEPVLSIGNRVDARSSVRGYDVTAQPDISTHLAKVAFAKEEGIPPYDSL